MKKKLGYRWFNLYIDWIPIWSFFLALVFFIKIVSILSEGFNFGYIIDIGVFVFYVKVICDISKSKENSIFELCISLLVNWIYRSLASAILSSQAEGNFVLDFFICLFLFGIWYVPNIVYFLKRLDGLEQREKNEKIEETDEEMDEFIRNLKKKNGEDYDFEYASKLNIVNNANISQSQKEIIIKEINLMSEKDITDVISKLQTKNEKTKEEDIKEQPIQKFCVNCGKPLQEDWKFCNFCGHKLK